MTDGTSGNIGAVLPSDGRDLDPRLADEAGAAVDQQSWTRAPDRPVPGAGRSVYDRVPSARVAGAASTYYGQPVVKAPPWGAPVAAYLVTGGVAGSAAALAATADLLGGPEQRGLVRAARAVAAGACLASAGLLVADLGRPERLLNMFRVFRPTSAMSVGAYVLSATTGASLVALVVGGRPGLLGAVGRAAGAAAGVAGVPLAGYTGVLLAATAVPGWNVGAETLPALFMASGTATTASALRLLLLSAPAARTVEVTAVVAQLAELGAEAAHGSRLRDRPRVRAAYDATWAVRAGRVLTTASLALGVLPTRRTPAGQVAAGVLGVAGSVLTKVAVFGAGMASAADPQAVPESG